MASLVIRNLNDQIHDALRGIAAGAGRPLEAEARVALANHVQAATTLNHTAAVKNRLIYVVEQTREVARTATYSKDRQWDAGAPYLAFRLGHHDATRVEAWMAGAAVPTFDDLAQVAGLFGIERNWLMFGTGAPYPTNSDRLPEDAQRAASELLEIEGQFSNLAALTFIRSSSREGELYIAKEYRDLRSTVCSTHIHISELIGAGGEAALMHFFVTLRLVYKIYCGGRRGFHCETLVRGALLDERLCQDLMSGQKHPALILPRRPQHWWEDIWDAAMKRDADYWPGYGSIKTRILSAIAGDKWLSDVISEIERGTLPILKHDAQPPR